MTPAEPVPVHAAAGAAGSSDAAAPAVVVAFRPRRRMRVPWRQALVALSLSAGLLVAGAGLLVATGRGAALGLSIPATRGMDLLALGFLAASGPYALLAWLERRRLLGLDRRLPDFLTDLASLHKAGLTLRDALLTAAQGNYGPLNPLIRRAADQVRWNVPVLTALENLKRGVGTPVADRIMTVILEAGRTGGNVPEVLDIASRHARASVNLRDQRAREMSTYTVITYVASAIFIGVCLAMQGVFVPRMIEAFQGTSGTLGLKSLPTRDAFRTLFFTAALVQAVGNGLVGGVMSDGRVSAGLRHAWTMVLLCLLGFALAG